jgi:hypothetical protein
MVLECFPETEMTENQIYQMWLTENEAEWKLDKDQVVSAQKLLEKMSGKDVEVIVMCEEPGMSAITFALKEPVEVWGEKTLEITVDGTCE